MRLIGFRMAHTRTLSKVAQTLTLLVLNARSFPFLLFFSSLCSLLSLSSPHLRATNLSHNISILPMPGPGPPTLPTFALFFLSAFVLSLNSLSVRVPHNSSCRVLPLHGPNPWLERFRCGFIVKPMFLFFIYMIRFFSLEKHMFLFFHVF